MSWLISFAWTYSSCEERGLSEHYKMKKNLTTMGFESVPSAYEANALTIELRDMISIEHLKIDRVLPECAIQIYL